MLQDLINSNLTPFIGNVYLLRVLSILVVLWVIIVIAFIAQYIIKKCVVRVINFILLRKTNSEFLHFIAKDKSLNILSHFIAAIVILVGSQLIIPHNNIEIMFVAFLYKFAELYIFITTVFIITRVVNLLNAYYERQFVNIKGYHPINSYLKILNLFIWLISLILIIAFFLNMSPWALLTGIGAVSAVMLFVFKDTLLGIVASIQVALQNILRVGDRITIDKYNIDGEVLNISINSVKIKNDDNSISNMPTFLLSSEVIKNWQPMKRAMARRIKRSFNLDIASIKICSDALLEQLQQFSEVREYILQNPNREYTNLGIFRIYIQNYLKKYPKINKKYLITVRHLDSGVYGLPLEIYAYTTEVNLEKFEQVQSDIFEYCFSILPIFELKVLQVPSA